MKTLLPKLTLALAANLLLATMAFAQQTVKASTDFTCSGLVLKVNTTNTSCFYAPPTAPTSYNLDSTHPVNFTVPAGQSLYSIEFFLNGTSFFSWACAQFFPQPPFPNSHSVVCNGQSVYLNVQGGPNSPAPSSYEFKVTTLP